MTPDGELLARYAETQDQEAFAELVRRHLDGVFSSALRRLGGDRHLAEDVTQQVFVALARQAASVARHPVLTAWLYVTTRNQSVMAVRAEQRRRAREKEAANMNDDNSSEMATTEGSWPQIAAVLDATIDELGESDRRAVLLRFIDQKSYREIGYTLGTTEDSARMRVDRSLHKLRARLAHRGVTSSAALLATALATHAVSAAPSSLAASTTAAAIATVPLTLTPLTAAVHFMTTSKALACVATGLLIAAAAGITTREWTQWTEANQELLRSEAENVQLRIEINKEATRLASLNTALSESRATAKEQAETSAQASTAASAPAARKSDPEATGKAFLERHPEVKASLAAWMTSTEDELYGDLFKSLHLTPAQIETFRSLVRQHNWFGRSLDDEGTWANFSLSTGKDDQTVGTEMEALLGPEGMRQYFETMKLSQPRRLVSTAAADLVFTSEPMTARQADELTATLMANTRFTATGSVIDWNALEAEAGVILSPAQMRALVHLRAADQINVETRRPYPVSSQPSKRKAVPNS